MNSILERVRRRFGNRVIYKRGALRDIINSLRRNEAVGILMDQSVVSDEGYVLEFLGKGAWTTKMPALIARKTGASVLPVFINRINGYRHVVKIYPEITLSDNQDRELAIKEDTRVFSRYIEDYVRQNPSEWLWIHRRWKRVKV
jgi:KDO2-lipid IV(A) lauroyltransferase